jgi:hypothetical protein
MPELDLHRIKETLAHLRKDQPRAFGAESHEFRLNPPLQEADVIAFERLHNIALPNDYRQFLTSVGNGGAGPFYGVFPLGMMDDGFETEEWLEQGNLVGIPSEPFAFEEEWNDLSARPTDNLADEDEYWNKMEEFERVYWGSALVNGAIPVCHEGCALRIWLVVKGPQAGYLWEDKRSEYNGLSPLRLADGSFATFESWYMEWLNACAKAN